MCMRNLNATILTCVDAKKSLTNNNVLTYNDVFDIIVPEEKADGKLYVSNFDIVVNMVAVFDNKKDDGISILRNQNYECLVSVTFDGLKYKGIGKFMLDTDETKLSVCGQRMFQNTTHLVNEQTFEIPENVTQCDLVLLIRNTSQDSEKWVFQTIKRLYINRIPYSVQNV